MKPHFSPISTPASPSLKLQTSSNDGLITGNVLDYLQIVVVGVILGGMVVALYLPIFEALTAIG